MLHTSAASRRITDPRGREPRVDFWAAHGFMVVQPTHLDSRTLGLRARGPRTPRIWRTRVDDLTKVLDDLGRIEAAVPGLAGRLDRGRIAAARHCQAGEDMSDARVTAGVLLSLTGTGGEDLTPFAAEAFGSMNPGFEPLITPALAVAGDQDQSVLSTRGPDWVTGGFRLAPGVEELLVLFGGEHSLGGIPGHGAAYLRNALGVEDSAGRRRPSRSPSTPARSAGWNPSDGRLDPGARAHGQLRDQDEHEHADLSVGGAAPKRDRSRWKVTSNPRPVGQAVAGLGVPCARSASASPASQVARRWA